MIEIRRIIPGTLVEKSIVNIAQCALNECVQAVIHKGGVSGEYRMLVQWISEDELVEEGRQTAG